MGNWECMRVLHVLIPRESNNRPAHYIWLKTGRQRFFLSIMPPRDMPTKANRNS